MHKTALFIMFALCHSMCYGQVTHVLNAPRGGDDVVRQICSLSGPGQAGSGVVWDFSELTVKRKKYFRRHTQDGEAVDSISATDYGTRYYYNVREDGVWETGYENNQTRLSYNLPIKNISFPTIYGDSCGGLFHGTGLYCDRQQMRAFGSWFLTADAEGSLILPSGDTLTHVLRIHLQKKISSRFYPTDSIRLALEPFDTDSILFNQATDTAIIVTDNYRWYAQGYRYPVLECQLAYPESNPDNKATLAFYCSPDNQEEYLADEENDGIREWLHSLQGDKSENNPIDKSFKYNFSQDADSKRISISYTADEPVCLKVILTSTTGILYNSLSQDGNTSGYFDLNYNGLPSGQYVVYIKTGKEIYTEKFKNQ